MSVAKARELLTRLRIRHEDEIEIELIAADLRLMVRRTALSSAEGRLVRLRKCGIISVADTAYRSHKWRFVIAHEIGHFLRHAKLNQLDMCTDADLRAAYKGREAEANQFAAELLMPRELFEPQCDAYRPSLRDMRKLADEFRTSVTSAALRFLLFTDEPCAVVQSTEGRVKWVSRSKSFRLWVPEDMRLTETTYAGDLHAGKNVEDRASQLDGDVWSDTRGAEDVELFEHSMKVAARSVLTFLWHPSGQ